MSTRNVLRALPVLGLLPGLASALGLGDIHLHSNLNAPLSAEIDLVSIAAGDLAGLRANLASRDAFTKAGLDYPGTLGTVSVALGKSADGRDVLKVASTDNAVEPFATLLIEVNWARGRLLREYTVLLDPPVFASQSAPVAVTAPTTSTAQHSGSVTRPVVEAPATQAPAATLNGGSYTVMRGDSLSQIIARQGFTGSQRVPALLATYRNNPGAFEGNMNLLRAGATLNLPAAADISAIDASTARAEVGQQYRNWLQTRAGSAGQGQLHLVPPSGEGSGAGNSGSGSGGNVAALQQRVNDLEAQLTESKRLLDLKNAELARLQAKAGATPPAATPTPPPAATETPATETPPTASTTKPAETPTPPVESSATPPAPAESTPAPKPAPAAAPPTASSGSWYDSLLDYWPVLLGAVALLAGLFGYRAWRQRQTDSFDRSLDRLGSPSFQDEPGGKRPSTAQTMPLRSLPDTHDAIVVEESGTHLRPKIADPAAEPQSVQVDDTISATGAVSLDQGDPLAEADFHMAYGLYDQAADLVRLAINREPGRRDLKLKLLEVFFVWGNKEQFLTVARELAGSRDQAPAGEWEKILIMGRQIAPEDTLFASASDLHGAGRAGIDLNLEGGQNRVDFDLQGEPSVAPAKSDSLDLDLNTVLGEKVTTAEVERLSASGVDFVLDDPTRRTDVTGSTREMPEAMAAETVTVDVDSRPATPEAPTVEQPRPNLDSTLGQTMRQKVNFQADMPAANSDRTTEVPIDDLGLDLGKLDSTLGGGALSTRELDTAGIAANSNDTSEMTTLSPSASGTWMFNDNELDLTAMSKPEEGGLPTQQITMITPQPSLSDTASMTASLKALDASAPVDFNLSESAIQKPGNGKAVDLDVGSANTIETASPFTQTQRLTPEEAASDLEPVTMSEVGTKLDLARAYMDMGDPEGARSILDEVLNEGSVSQKQEARRLIESLPG